MISFEIPLGLPILIRTPHWVKGQVVNKKIVRKRIIFYCGIYNTKNVYLNIIIIFGARVIRVCSKYVIFYFECFFLIK